MRKMKTSLYGYDKKAVRELINRLQDEHGRRLKSLQSEYDRIQADIKDVEERIRSREERGQKP
ncbi:hypothetical protein [Paenibacillus thermotolerans]|uniref:hypothetical protein n=1 Tax=Paenibacillus thermotolerans TaxID=3027807 RepID=UPI002367C068|nr:MULTISPECIES: hypothetical protein [unclassified Paenibacillus]